ncbi:hypothetical protein DFH09DRAFT_1091117 [Mycena vulgaris]|nr:hypothetical protein DFH09DRAFT_1091117 [Mycena vulgaris]
MSDEQVTEGTLKHSHHALMEKIMITHWIDSLEKRNNLFYNDVTKILPPTLVVNRNSSKRRWMWGMLKEIAGNIVHSASWPSVPEHDWNKRKMLFAVDMHFKMIEVIVHNSRQQIVDLNQAFGTRIGMSNGRDMINLIDAFKKLLPDVDRASGTHPALKNKTDDIRERNIGDIQAVLKEKQAFFSCEPTDLGNFERIQTAEPDDKTWYWRQMTSKNRIVNSPGRALRECPMRDGSRALPCKVCNIGELSKDGLERASGTTLVERIRNCVSRQVGCLLLQIGEVRVNDSLPILDRFRLRFRSDSESRIASSFDRPDSAFDSPCRFHVDSPSIKRSDVTRDSKDRFSDRFWVDSFSLVSRTQTLRQMAFWRHLTVPEIWLVTCAGQAIVEFAKRDPELKPFPNSKRQSFRISRVTGDWLCRLQYSGSSSSCEGKFDGNDDNGKMSSMRISPINWFQRKAPHAASNLRHARACPTSSERVSVTEATRFKSPVLDAQFGKRGSQHLIAAHKHRISDECQDPTRIQTHHARPDPVRPTIPNVGHFSSWRGLIGLGAMIAGNAHQGTKTLAVLNELVDVPVKMNVKRGVLYIAAKYGQGPPEGYAEQDTAATYRSRQSPASRGPSGGYRTKTDLIDHENGRLIGVFSPPNEALSPGNDAGCIVVNGKNLKPPDKMQVDNLLSSRIRPESDAQIWGNQLQADYIEVHRLVPSRPSSMYVHQPLKKAECADQNEEMVSPGGRGSGAGADAPVRLEAHHFFEFFDVLWIRQEGDIKPVIR